MCRGESKSYIFSQPTWGRRPLCRFVGSTLHSPPLGGKPRNQILNILKPEYSFLIVEQNYPVIIRQLEWVLKADSKLHQFWDFVT